MQMPRLLFCDKGSEFPGQAMDLWAFQDSAKIGFSHPDKPADNAFLESFNRTFRDECLNAHSCETLAEAKQGKNLLAFTKNKRRLGAGGETVKMLQRSRRNGDLIIQRECRAFFASERIPSGRIQGIIHSMGIGDRFRMVKA